MVKYAVAVFLSAFLLFQVQPIIARYILPWFGGASSVWTICLVFFQVFLLLGYLYAHLLSRVARPKVQAAIHCVLVLLAVVLFLPIEPSQPAASLQGGADPQLDILLLLVFTVGLPYALISSSGPLFQSWFQSVFPTGQTYRLYALSNVGSLLGLISYPFVIEPFLTLKSQTGLWSAGFIAYLLVCLACLWSLREVEGTSSATQQGPEVDSETRVSDILLWIALAATASVLLLATTNQITQDIASVPFLWILPLSLYLISFIICFDKPGWYQRRIWIPLLLVSVGVALVALLLGSTASFWYQVVAYTGILFVGCMVCHGELYRKKPHPNFLTKYYLTISFGGALGGFFVAMIAPQIFSGYWELEIAWVVMLVLAGLCIFDTVVIRSRVLDLTAQTGWILMCFVLSLMLYAHIENTKEDNTEQLRGFYGVLTVSEMVFDEKDPTAVRDIRLLKNGAIIHGSQMRLNDSPVFSATSYYGPESGVGVAIRHFPVAKKELTVGVLGMGAATIASLCQDCGDMTFFEIDPNVIAMEEKYFSYLADVRALGVSAEVVLGDGRIALQQRVAQAEPYQFDVLAVDAFSGDSIPVHLLTMEALLLYWQNLSPDGVLAMHVSNRHLDLTPIVVAFAKELDKKVFRVTNKDVDDQAIYSSDWILMTKNDTFLDAISLSDRCVPGQTPSLPLWTDQYSNILRILQTPETRSLSDKPYLTCFD
jgi:spermidine synthase